MVEVPVWAYNPDTNDYEPLVKDDKPVMETVRGDLDAFAPNQPQHHPLNLRHRLAREAIGRKAEWQERPFDKLTQTGVRVPEAYKKAVN